MDLLEGIPRPTSAKKGSYRTHKADIVTHDEEDVAARTGFRSAAAASKNPAAIAPSLTHPPRQLVRRLLSGYVPKVEVSVAQR